jgi:N-carbamoylputrescine amidase
MAGMKDDGSASLRVALVQLSMSDSTSDNLERALARIREAAEQNARLVCLPELFRSRYFCQAEDSENFVLAETVPGPSTEALGALARELGITIVASLFEKRAAGIYHNTAVLLDRSGSVVGRYRKMHIPDDPRYYEKFYFTPGDTGFPAFPAEGSRVGILVCWDQWYPEAARLAALSGAEILVYPTAIGWHPEEKATVGEEQHSAWETVQRSHAIANGCYVLSVNRTGFEPDPAGGGIEFWGQSFVVAPSGRVIARAAADQEAVLVADLDLAAVGDTRVAWPFLRDRRIDAYRGITERYLDPE